MNHQQELARLEALYEKALAGYWQDDIKFKNGAPAMMNLARALHAENLVKDEVIARLVEALEKLSDPLLNYRVSVTGTAGAIQMINAMATDAKAALAFAAERGVGR